MKQKLFLLTIGALFIMCACNNSDINKKELPDAEPIVLKNTEKVESDNLFALDLLKSTVKNSQETNIFISPLSMSFALNMTLNGAKESTADEMISALREQGYTLEEINEYSKEILEALLKVDPSTKINIANSIWIKEGFEVKSEFVEVNKAFYNAEVRNLDFSSSQALDIINGWCAKQTNDKIKNVLDNISPETCMFLINAIYFKGIWKSQFDKKNTKKENFTTENGTTQQVNMMSQQNPFNVSFDNNAGYIELPYGNKAFSMVIILPNEGKTTDDVIASLDNESWSNMQERMSGTEVNLKLPRFKAECKYLMNEKVLPELGMNIPFSDMANFSGMSNASLKISKVIHQTFVEVNEEGTEAAAVTVVEMIKLAGTPSLPIDFIVNKPFIFMIKEKSTGVIMFTGKIGEVKE